MSFKGLDSKQVKTKFLKTEIDRSLDDIIKNVTSTDLQRNDPQTLDYFNNIFGLKEPQKEDNYGIFSGIKKIRSSKTGELISFRDDLEAYFKTNMAFLVKNFLVDPDLLNITYHVKDEEIPWSKRMNGINHRVTHSFEVSKILAQSGASIETTIAGLNHDFAEDLWELSERELSLPGINIFKSSKSKKFLNEKINEVEGLWNKYNEFIQLSWDNRNSEIKNSMPFIDTKIIKNIMTRVTRFEETDYKKDVASIFEMKRKDKVIDIYRAAQVKLSDRIHNIGTVRPNHEEFEKFIKEKRIGHNPNYSPSSRFGFENFKEAVYENRNFLFFPAWQQENQRFHKYIQEQFDDSGRVFNTANHSFIIKNTYKNIIILSHLNQFLDKSPIQYSKDYQVLRNLRKELIQKTKEEVTFQLSHLVNYHVDLKHAKEQLLKAREYKHTLFVNEKNQEIINGGYSSITKSINSAKSLDGFVEGTLEKLLKNNKEVKSKIDAKETKETTNERFDTYLNLYHMLEEFEENDSFNYSQLTQAGSIKPILVTPMTNWYLK